MTDWAQEGLLEGLDPQACDARARLLDELEAEGVGLDELRQAVAEDRLALLPVERELAGEARYTAHELASESGLPVDFLTRQWRALGLSAADPDERIYTEADLEAARRSARFRDAGYRDESALETARVIGQAMARVADSLRLITGETMARAGDSEHDISWRYAGAAKNMLPEVGPLLEHVLALHLRDQTRSDFISHVELESGDLRGAREVAVAFADLVGFTQLGSETPADQLGAVAGRLEEMASAVAEPPVRLVKTIGDAAMLAAPEPAPLLDAVLTLVAAAEEEGGEFPQLKAGIASGAALNRAGDWYGHPVNLASRITGVARPGSVLASAEVHDALEDAYRWSFVGERRLKGLGEVKVFRARPSAVDGDDAGDAAPSGTG